MAMSRLTLGRTPLGRMMASKMTCIRMTFSRMTFSTMTLNKTTCIRMTLSTMLLSKMTLSKMTLSKMTLIQMTCIRMTPSTMTLSKMTLKISFFINFERAKKLLLHYTRLEGLTRDKQCSLLGPFISYEGTKASGTIFLTVYFLHNLLIDPISFWYITPNFKVFPGKTLKLVRSIHKLWIKEVSWLKVQGLHFTTVYFLHNLWIDPIRSWYITQNFKVFPGKSLKLIWSIHKLWIKWSFVT